eukprot:jgi/Hompol1/6348/HPOL_002028-RA
MIRAVQPASKWKLLVVDAQSAKLLNVICKSHEILEENVTRKISPALHRTEPTVTNSHQQSCTSDNLLAHRYPRTNSWINYNGFVIRLASQSLRKCTANARHFQTTKQSIL